jgi:hypothetical protein
MNSPIFLSSVAPFLNQFVQYKRALNRKYCADAEVLRLFGPLHPESPDHRLVRNQ